MSALNRKIHSLVATKWFLVLMAVVCALSGARSVAQPVHEGPLFTEFKLTLEQGTGEEAVGPLYYAEHSASRDLTALPPLWSCTRYREVDAEEVDVLYPLVSYDRFGPEYRFHIMQVFSFSGGLASQTETNVSRFTIFPLYFQQRSSVPEKNYTAVFPFYGKLQNRLFRDEIEFALWPLYAKTKRLARSAPSRPREEFAEPVYRFFESRRGDVTTYNYLVPIFHVRTGEGLKGWQVWPLAGAEHKKVSAFTNRWDDVLIDEGHEKFFALWPLYMREKTALGTTNPETSTIVFPLFSSLKSPLRDSLTAPCFVGLTLTVDRAKKYREWGAPWPAIVFARGEGKTTSRVWPFFSQSPSDTMSDNWYLWPAYKCDEIHSPPLDRRRTRLFFFLASDTVEKNTETGRAKRRMDVFPFYSFSRDWEGNERFQALSIVEPFVPASKSIERNYSHLWSVLRLEKNAVTGAESQSVLWSLYRSQGTVTNQSSSLLFGLLQWQAGPQARKARWFYLPFEATY